MLCNTAWPASPMLFCAALLCLYAQSTPILLMHPCAACTLACPPLPSPLGRRACLQVGTSLCNFLTLNASFTHHQHHRSSAGLSNSHHTAQVLLEFGSPLSHLQASSRGCGLGPGDAAAAAAAAEQSALFEWPEFVGLEVLGWHLPIEALAAEVVQRAGSCGGLAVVQRLALPASAATARPAGLHLDLSALRHRLECPYGLRLSWRSQAAVVEAA